MMLSLPELALVCMMSFGAPEAALGGSCRVHCYRS